MHNKNQLGSGSDSGSSLIHIHVNVAVTQYDTAYFNDEKPFLAHDVSLSTLPTFASIKTSCLAHSNAEKNRHTHNHIHTLISHEIWKKILLNIQFTYIECFIIAAPRIQIWFRNRLVFYGFFFCSYKSNSGM